MSRLRAMPGLFVLAALAGCAGRSTPPTDRPEVATAAPFRVVSFNIRYGTANDGTNHWRLRKDDVLATIRRQRPDILAVQEALDFQVRVLEDALPGHVRIGVGRDGEHRGEFSALFVDSQRFTVLDSGTEWLGETPREVGSRSWGAALPRIVTWATLEDRTGHRLAVLNTHFDHRSALARTNSAKQIAGMLDRFFVMPVVVTGDLNTGERSEPLDILRAAALRDTFRSVHPDEREAGTFGGFRGRSDGNKIDYVLVGSGFEVIDAWIDRTKTADGRDPSDHFPVGAELRLLP